MNQTQSSGADARRIAFIQATWHRDIVDRGRDGFLARLEALGFPRAAVDLFEVPGSLEIPLQAKLLANTGRYAAVVAAGFVVDGGIYRHEFVAQAVLDGLMRVGLDTEVPVLSMVLTPQNFHEHVEHHGFFFDHMVKKGEEAAEACIHTIEAVRRVRESTTAAAA